MEGFLDWEATEIISTCLDAERKGELVYAVYYPDEGLLSHVATISHEDNQRYIGTGGVRKYVTPYTLLKQVMNIN